jgi:hypothetical protein
MTVHCQEDITVNFSPISRPLSILPEVGRSATSLSLSHFGLQAVTDGHLPSASIGLAPVISSRSLRAAQSRTRIPSLALRPSLSCFNAIMK